MSRFSGTDAEGKRVVGVGITHQSYSRMLQGEITVVDLEPLGVPGVRLMLVAGPDEPAIALRLRDNMSSRTNVELYPGLVMKPNMP